MVRTFLFVYLSCAALGSAGKCDSSTSANCQDRSDPAVLLQKKFHVAHHEPRHVHHPVMVIPGHPVSLVDEEPKTMKAPGPGHVNPPKHAVPAGNTDNQGHLETRVVKEVETILGEVAELDNDDEAAKALEDIKNDEENASQKILGEDHDEVMKAIEEESRETSAEEEFNKTDTVITARFLREVNGLKTSPEENNVAGGNHPEAVQGDMLLPKNETAKAVLLQAIAQGQRFVPTAWKDNMAIPYCFSSSIRASAKQAFLDAVQHFEDIVPCLGFTHVSVRSENEKKCSTWPAIFVHDREGSGCFANVGEPQWDSWDSQCHLGAGCDSLGIAGHELGHNLGMLHEQSRHDAHNYVRVLWNNIQDHYKDQYKLSNADTNIDYDVMSLMHYSDDAFGKYGTDGRPMKTMQFKGSSHRPMGNRQGLTYNDAKQMAEFYGCSNQLNHFELCTEKADGCSSSSCTCHQGVLQKFKNGNSCYQCAYECPKDGTGTSGHCGCGEGYEKFCFGGSSGSDFCGCKVDSSGGSSDGGSSGSNPCASCINPNNDGACKTSSWGCVTPDSSLYCNDAGGNWGVQSCTAPSPTPPPPPSTNPCASCINPKNDGACKTSSWGCVTPDSSFYCNDAGGNWGVQSCTAPQPTSPPRTSLSGCAPNSNGYCYGYKPDGSWCWLTSDGMSNYISDGDGGRSCSSYDGYKGSDYCENAKR